MSPPKRNSPEKEPLYNDDEIEYFISKKALICRLITGFVALAALGSACLLTGYYFGFLFSQGGGIGRSSNVGQDSSYATDVYLIGVGRADVTGPIAQVNMMGYANPAQIANGLHMRLYARSFVVGDAANKSRVAFVTVDCGMGSQIIKLEVIKRLRAKYGQLYTERNVVISGTHSHSGPAGFFQTLLPEVTSLGAIKQTTEAFVTGIVESISMAHASMKEGTIKVGRGDVVEGNINRSPFAYTHDPAEERARYEFNTEQELTLLKFESERGEPIGMFNWFPVHGTSMNNTNGLISSDNKGRASALFENMMRKPHELQTGNESFVGAFASANLGDVSPRTKGPICVDSGKSCDFAMSTCGEPPRVKNCVALGPGADMFESTDIIARRQLDTARRAFNSADVRLSGPVGWVHQYVDMTRAPVRLDDGTNTTTCKPGMGYSFAAGTTDGAGAFNFVQSMTQGTPLWDFVRDEIIVKVVCSESPPQAYYDCHHPKPVLLPTGYMDKPYAWHPTIIDVQMLKVGQLIIVAVPGEFTTMAGRRIKHAVREQAKRDGIEFPEVVLAGLSNVYTHYITTPEEYQAQRYEGASTIYGPHTFTAYLQKYSSLVEHLVKGTQGSVDPGPQPANLLDRQIELLPAPLADSLPAGVQFGDVIDDAGAAYAPGDDVAVSFYGANPRHNMKLGSTYLTVERQDSATNATRWRTEYVDADWETRFAWEEKSPFAPDDDARKERNIITALFELVASAFGVRFDYLAALESTSWPDHVTGALRDRRPPVNNIRAVDQADFSAESHVTITWSIPRDQRSGTYRIRYHGDHKDATSGAVTPFVGTSRAFAVQP